MGLGNLNKHKGAAGKFDPVPNGVYGCQIIETEMDKTKNGHDMLVVKYRILRKLNDEQIDQKSVVKRTVYENFPTNAGFRMDHLRQLAIAAGYTEEDLEKNPDFNGSEILKSFVQVRLKTRTYEGKPSNEVVGGDYNSWEPGAEDKLPEFEEPASTGESAAAPAKAESNTDQGALPFEV